MEMYEKELECLLTAYFSPLSLFLCTISIHKVSQESNSASQSKLNDHTFQTRCAIVSYQQFGCKTLYESKLRIMVLPSDNCSSGFMRITYRDALTQNNFLKIQSSNSNKGFFSFCKFKKLFGLSIFFLSF